MEPGDAKEGQDVGQRGVPSSKAGDSLKAGAGPQTALGVGRPSGLYVAVSGLSHNSSHPRSCYGELASLLYQGQGWSGTRNRKRGYFSLPSLGPPVSRNKVPHFKKDGPVRPLWFSG